MTFKAIGDVSCLSELFLYHISPHTILLTITFMFSKVFNDTEKWLLKKVNLKKKNPTLYMFAYKLSLKGYTSTCWTEVNSEMLNYG